MNNKNFTLVIDKYTNLLHASVFNISIITYINKFIGKLVCLKHKLLTTYVNTNIINQFNKHVIKIIRCFNVLYFKKIIIKIKRCNITLVDNKILITIGKIHNILVYIPNMKNLTIQLYDKNKVIYLSGQNEIYLTNLASLLKNLKKIDEYSGVGMFYENEKILFKKRNIKNVKK